MTQASMFLHWFFQFAYHRWVPLHSFCRNHYCYLAVIFHHRAKAMPVFGHLLTKQCVKTGHFTLAHCLGWVGGCLVWLLPLLLLTEVGATRELITGLAWDISVWQIQAAVGPSHFCCLWYRAIWWSVDLGQISSVKPLHIDDIYIYNIVINCGGKCPWHTNKLKSAVLLLDTLAAWRGDRSIFACNVFLLILLF